MFGAHDLADTDAAPPDKDIAANAEDHIADKLCQAAGPRAPKNRQEEEKDQDRGDENSAPLRIGFDERPNSEEEGDADPDRAVRNGHQARLRPQYKTGARMKQAQDVRSETPDEIEASPVLLAGFFRSRMGKTGLLISGFERGAAFAI